MYENDPFRYEILDDEPIPVLEEEVKETNSNTRESFNLIQSFSSEIYKLEDAKREADKYIAEFQECIKVEKLKLFEKYQYEIQRVEELKKRYGEHCRYGDYHYLELNYDNKEKKLYIKSDFLGREGIIYKVRAKMLRQKRGEKKMDVINSYSSNFAFNDFNIDNIGVLNEVIKSEVDRYIDQKFASLEKEKFVNQSDRIRFTSATNILSNIVLLENGYFEGIDYTKEEIDDLTTFENGDLELLEKYKDHAIDMIRDLLKDVEDGKFVALALEKLEEVTINE